MRRGYRDYILYEDGVYYTRDPETAISEGWKEFTYEAFNSNYPGKNFADRIFCNSYEQACRLVNHWNREFNVQNFEGWFYNLKP